MQSVSERPSDSRPPPPELNPSASNGARDGQAEAQRLRALRRYDVLDTPPEESFDRIARLAANHFDALIALVSLVDAERLWFKSCYGVSRREMDRKDSACNHVIRDGEVMVVEDATQDDRFADNPLVTGDPNIRFYAGAPLVTPDGHALGTLCVLDTKPRSFDENDAAYLDDLAAMVVDELELRRETAVSEEAAAELQRRVHLEKTVADISAELLSNGGDVDAVLAMLGEAIDVSRVYLFQMREDGERMDNTHEWTGPDAQPQIEHFQDLDTANFPWGLSNFRRNEPFIVPDVDALPEEAEAERAIMQDQGIRSVLAIPIQFSDGTLRGFIGFSDTQDAHDWADEETRLLRVVSDLLAGYLERRHDERMIRAARRETEQVLASIDDAFFALDDEWRFTYLNDEAERVLERTRDDLIGRNVWDEFPEAVNSIFDEQYHRAVREGVAVDFETFYPPLDVWVEVHAYPFAGGLSVLFEDINERKEREERLRLMESAVSSANDTVIIGNANTGDGSEPTIVYANEAFTRQTGYAREEVIGQTPALLQGPETDPETVEQLRASFRNNEPARAELLTYRKDGSTFWAEVNVELITDETDGAATHWVSVRRDMTERKDMEQALRESEAKFRGIAETITQVFWMTTPEKSEMLYLSPAYEKIWGRSREEVYEHPRRWIEYIHPDDRARVQKAAHEDQEDGNYDEEYRIRRPDGAIRWIRDRAYPARGDDGEVEHIVGVAEDITERREAEAALRESEERFRKLVQHAADIITVVEADGTIRYESPAAEKILGHEPDGRVGASAFERIHPDDVEETRALFEQILRQPEAVLTAEFRVRNADDGSWVPLEAAAKNMLDDPVIEGIVIHARDMTESLRLEAEREARQQAEELLAAKTSFMNNMSHELRTPLAGIVGFADVLAEETEGVHKEFAERIGSSSKRLQETLSSVMDLARLEGGTINLEWETVDVAHEAEDALSLFEHKADERGVALHLESPDEPARARLDARCLHRVLNNLISNALKFTEEGSVTVTVETSAGRVYVRVADTGVGISDDFLPNLFADFEQESSGLSRRHEGSGLGLSITKRLVDAMYGSVDVESTKGEGSTFTVSFPRSPAAGNGEASEPASDAAAPPAGVPGGNKVLVVEDTDSARDLAKRMLRDECEVACASDPETALTLARRHAFDAVLLDIDLSSQRDGVDVLHRLRAMPEYVVAPIVAVTAYAMPGDEARFLDQGFDAYVSKPFNKTELREAIREVLAAGAT